MKSTLGAKCSVTAKLTHESWSQAHDSFDVNRIQHYSQLLAIKRVKQTKSTYGHLKRTIIPIQ